jgi:probable rRNA maturation factor
VDPDSKRLRVSVSDGTGRVVRDGGLARWLAAVAPPRAAGEVSVALVSDLRMRALNRKYRRKNKVTDVLAFENGALGDLAIATGVARRQARDAGHSYQTELRVLALHGLLHLLGYDHHDRGDNGRMRRVEAALRRKGGLATGLIERASTPGAAKLRRVGA